MKIAQSSTRCRQSGAGYSKKSISRLTNKRLVMGGRSRITSRLAPKITNRSNDGDSRGRRLTVVFISIGYFGGGLSGGDVAWLNLAKRLSSVGLGIVVLTSGAGKKAYINYGLREAKYLVVDQGKDWRDSRAFVTGWELIRRIFNALRLIRQYEFPKETCFVSTSDLLHENVVLLGVPRDRDYVCASVFHMVYQLPTSRLGLGGVGYLSSIFLHFQQVVSLLVVKLRANFMVANSNTFEFLSSANFSPNRLLSFPLHLVNINMRLIRSMRVTDKKYDAYWIGRYSRRKGFEDLLLVWSAITKQRPSAKLAIIGSACYHPESLRLLDEANLPGVELKGFLSEEEKLVSIRESQLLLHTSHNEGQATTPWEALACDVPVVCYDLPFNQTLPGALRVKPFETARMAEACIRILDDSALSKRLLGQIRSSEFDLNDGTLACAIERRLRRHWMMESVET